MIYYLSLGLYELSYNMSYNKDLNAGDQVLNAKMNTSVSLTFNRCFSNINGDVPNRG